MTQIKGSLNRAIEALEVSTVTEDECSCISARECKLCQLHRQALADLRALKEAVPDGLEDAVSYSSRSYFVSTNFKHKDTLKAAKLISEAISDE